MDLITAFYANLTKKIGSRFRNIPIFNFLYFFISFQQGRLFLCVFVLFLQLIPERKGETQLLLQRMQAGDFPPDQHLIIEHMIQDVRVFPALRQGASGCVPCRCGAEQPMRSVPAAEVCPAADRLKSVR